MICPILTISAVLDNTHNSQYDCKESECSWWCYTDGSCSIKKIAMGLDKINIIQEELIKISESIKDTSKGG